MRLRRRECGRKASHHTAIWDFYPGSLAPEVTLYHLPGGTQWRACLVTQLCSTLWDPMDCSPSGSSVHGIPQARILEWLAIPFSRGSSRPRDRPCSLVSPALAGGFFTIWATWEAQEEPRSGLKLGGGTGEGKGGEGKNRARTGTGGAAAPSAVRGSHSQRPRVFPETLSKLRFWPHLTLDSSPSTLSPCLGFSSP